VTAIASPDGFDFIVFADVKGRLVMFEAFQPDRRVVLAQLMFPVCFADYNGKGDWLIVISPAGKLILITHPFSMLA
jgi:hypothetical protein